MKQIFIVWMYCVFPSHMGFLCMYFCASVLYFVLYQYINVFCATLVCYADLLLRIKNNKTYLFVGVSLLHIDL